jgi:hypothetical protein
MIERLQEIERALKDLKNNLSTAVAGIVRNDNGQYLDLNRDQMSKGENRTETPIGRLKSPKYAARKKAKGGKAPIGSVDLKDRGDYYENLKKIVSDKFVEVRSGDPDKIKVDGIKAKYGEQHLNLSEANQSKYTSLVIQPQLIKLVRSKLKLNAV